MGARLIPEARLIREIIARKGFRAFIPHFWPYADKSSRFVHNWHVDAIADHCEAVSRGQIRNLVINVPPGTGKSTIVSVLWPAWHWSRAPHWKFMIASFDQSLVLRDAGRMLDVVTAPLYAQCFPEFDLGGRAKAAGCFHNTHGGLRFSTTPEGKATGWHVHAQIVDDPIKPKDAHKRAQAQAVLEWWRGTMATRAVDPATLARVIIMQRLSEDDLAGAMLAEGYEHLCLPMRYVPRCVWDRGSSLGAVDPRTEPGELLFPERFSEETLADRARAMGAPATIEAQEQQNPIPDTGGILERAWLDQEWRVLPPRVRLVQSWDLGFKGAKASHSRVHGALWAESDNKYYLIAETLGHWNYPLTKRRILEIQADPVNVGNRVIHWKDAIVRLIEDKANGTAVIAELRDTLPGIVPVVPKDDKATRLIAHTDRFQTGRVVFPSKECMPTVDEFRAELVGFPRAAHDDRVDTTTQALDHLSGPYTRLAANLEKLSQTR